MSTAELTGTLIGEVDRLGRYVQSRMWGFPSEVDNVLQESRLSVWRCADRFDPALGAPEQFVFGVVSRVTSKEIGRLLRQPITTPIEDISWSVSDGKDVLDVLVDEYEDLTQEDRVTEWITLVADAASEIEWAAVTALHRFDGDTAEAANYLGMGVGTLRAARGRVRTLVRTARAALEMLELGMVPVASSCVPTEGGMRDILPYIDSCPSTQVAAEALGIAEGVYRTRRALARRAVDLVERIATSHVPEF